MIHLTSEQLDELERLEKAATPGRWETLKTQKTHAGIKRVYTDELGRRCTSFPVQCCSTTEPNAENARFIGTLRNVAPALIAMAREPLAVNGGFEEVV